MQIVAANLLDLNALHTMEKACFPQDAWPLFDLIAVLSFAGVVRLKAVENHQMVGFIAGDPRPQDDLSWVATLSVLPEHRGKGIARALLETCEAQLSTERVRLCVRQSNGEAMRLYTNAGYRLVDRWRSYYNGGEDAVVMEKVRPHV
ncbi:MAG: hypothetical protein CO094_04310 [Anaerolineae bacterium CG_4_9_14_3_um_filter_57_17]|nr:GNAT family N-acetyltransferase [bacterium]NCT21799.1 GNAT family N-acetyltransferase [bacterium]OIO83854.1 MAG: hypothetical protein AUK01_11515 [Anaerolineae bacterium CG2_30_57_67]PJB67329.1 MAG: hypothetical protein CO094_04310 [Anaerolineae bacterium CG_4_9_14_3_um_filter_57_17]